MLKRFLFVVLMAALMAGASATAGDLDLNTADIVPETITTDTNLHTTTGTVASQTNQNITIVSGNTLTIGVSGVPSGLPLSYTLNSITSNGAASGLVIDKAVDGAAGTNGTTVTMNTLNFTAGGTVTISDGEGTGAGINKLIVDTFTAGNAAAFSIGSYSTFQVAETATFSGGSSLAATAANNFVSLDSGARLIMDGSRLVGTAATLNIGNSDTGIGQVVFQGSGSQIAGTINAAAVDTVVNGGYSFAANATYTTKDYTHNSGNATGVNNTTLHVLGDAVINGGMTRPGTMIVDGTFTINANGTGHADHLVANEMAPVQSGGVDMILDHTIRTGGYTILADAFVKGCRMTTNEASIEFLMPDQVFQVQQNGILSTLENELVIRGDGATLDLGGYYMTDHNVNNNLYSNVGFNSITGMNKVVIQNTAVLVLGERQQHYYNSGAEIFVGDDVILKTVADGATAGSITGMFANVSQLTSNTWGYYSYFGDFELALKQDGGNDVLSIDSFTASNYRNYASNQAQLAKMGLNPNASDGVLQNLQQLAVDITGYLDTPIPPTPAIPPNPAHPGWPNGYDPTYYGKAPEFGLSYDAGSTGGYDIGYMGVSTDSNGETYSNVAGRLNRDMYSSIVNGSRVFQTDRRVDNGDYIGFINGVVDGATWEYMNAATVNNVIRANQRAMLTASDMVYDRLAGYSYNVQNVYSAVGSDYGMAAAILNANYLNRFWVSGIGQWDDADDRGGFAGYQYDSYGFATGYDRVIGAFILGGSFAYTTGDYEDDYASAHDSDIDNYAFNLYATYNHCSGFFGTLVGGYTYSENDINELRGGNWAGQDFHTNTWYVSGKVGYNWRPVQGLTLTPSVGLGYIHSRASDHDGIYAGIANQRFGKMKADTGFIPIELRANYDWCVGAESTFGLNAKVGYTYNFDEDAASGNAFLYGMQNASPIRAVGRDMGHSAWNVGIGAKYTYKRFDFGVNYDYIGMSDFDSHRVTATVGIGF